MYKEFREHPTFTDLLQYQFMLNDHTIVCKDKTIFSIYELEGIDITIAMDSEVSRSCRDLNRAIMQNAELDYQFISVHLPVDLDFGDETTYFKNTVAATIEEKRNENIQESQDFFETKNYFVLMFKPKGKPTELTLKEINEFSKVEKNFVSSLGSSLSARPLRHVNNNNELIALLKTMVTGKRYKISSHERIYFIDSFLHSEVDNTDNQFKKIDDNYVTTISFDSLGNEDTTHGLMMFLNNINSTYTTSFSFEPLDIFEAKKFLHKQLKYHEQRQTSILKQATNTVDNRPNLDAVKKKNEILEVQADVSNGNFTVGDFAGSITLFHEDIEELKEIAEKTVKYVRDMGLVAIHETYNCMRTYLSGLPAMCRTSLRKSVYTSENFSDCVDFNTSYTGNTRNPSPFINKGNSPCLMKVKNEINEVFYLNLHKGDLGHSLIIGPTGAGKSTLLATIFMQFQRYENHKIFAFDKGMSMYPVTLASKGIHYELGEVDEEEYGESSNETLAFAPLAHLSSTTINFSWEQSFIELLLKLNNHTPTPKQVEAITHALKLFARSRGGKTLTSFVSTLQDNELKTALNYYTNKGILGHLLDASENSLKDADIMTFEIEALMNNGDDKSTLPVLSYLFNLIEKKLDGSPSMLILDEAWLMLSHPFFREKIREWLKVLRKANCAVILATQSLSDAVNSGILDVLQESCPTKIFLPNSEAMNSTESIGLYQKFGLNDRDVQIITDATPKREYFFYQAGKKRCMSLGLSRYELAFVGTSAKDDIKRIKYFHKEHGDDWVEAWLNYLKISSNVSAFEGKQMLDIASNLFNQHGNDWVDYFIKEQSFEKYRELENA